VATVAKRHRDPGVDRLFEMIAADGTAPATPKTGKSRT
jgi:hypothetical protein